MLRLGGGIGQAWCRPPVNRSKKTGAKFIRFPKTFKGELPYDERAKYERNPQRSTLLYTDDPELASSLLERMGAPAFDGFSPTFQHAGIDFLESVINEDLSWKTAKQINLVEAIGPPCYAVILPSDKYDSWYRYDKAGNITRLKRKQTHPTSGAWSLNQMEYSYPAGLTSNRLEKVAGPAALYSTKYSYDANGNMASDQAPGISAVSYDWRNRPTNMTTSSSTYFYRYDASGLRSYCKVQPISGPAQVEYFLPGMVLDANGAILRFDIADGFAEIDANGKMKRNHVLKDWLGTPRMTLDASGAVAQAGDYYPYGRTIDQRSYTAVAEADRHRFTGHEHDAESGYDYHGARYFQPEVGRYLGVDVMANSRSAMSTYIYVQANPVNRIDPNGALDYEFDQNGKRISDLGGSSVDFHHLRNGDTKVVNRLGGGSNIILGGEKLIRGYSQRSKDIGWLQITYEWDQGVGPTKSLISDFEDSRAGAFGSLDNINSTYASKARMDVQTSGLQKNRVMFNYMETNPLTALFDGWEQMWGRTTISWYLIGDKVLFMMTDSKSLESAGYRVLPSHERSVEPLNGNTYQTYLWTEKITEIISKNAVLKRKAEKQAELEERNSKEQSRARPSRDY